MTTVIIAAALGFVLSALAGYAKSHMDTIVFWGDYGFLSYPGNLRHWLLTGIPEAKWRDGWHVCQQVWHLAYGVAFYSFGLAAWTAVEMWAGGSLLWFVLAFAGCWALRLCAHGIGFSLTYPIK